MTKESWPIGKVEPRIKVTLDHIFGPGAEERYTKGIGKDWYKITTMKHEEFTQQPEDQVGNHEDRAQYESEKASVVIADEEPTEDELFELDRIADEDRKDQEELENETPHLND